MTKPPKDDLAPYLRASNSWASGQAEAQRGMMRLAWGLAAGLGVIALVEGIALASLVPLKTVVPYTLLVDRQTGYVQALKPLDQAMVAPDAALTRSMLAQYVLAREGFDIDSLKEDYRKVALWSTGEARQRYIAGMQATNPASPLARLPRRALVEVEVRSVASLGPNTALVRFATHRADGGTGAGPEQLWQAVISYRFSGAAMSAGDRLLNPLGFQVTRYQRDAELAPAPAQPAAGQGAADLPARAQP